MLMPENMFYNTSAPGIILIIDKEKKHKGEIMLINASEQYSKGQPKNYLSDRNDYNLSPSRYVVQNGEDDTLSLEDAVVLLKEAEEEREDADDKLNDILDKMGLND